MNTTLKDYIINPWLGSIPFPSEMFTPSRARGPLLGCVSWRSRRAGVMESPPQGELRATLPGPRPAELLRGTCRAEQVATQSRPWGPTPLRTPLVSSRCSLLRPPGPGPRARRAAVSRILSVERHFPDLKADKVRSHRLCFGTRPERRAQGSVHSGHNLRAATETGTGVRTQHTPAPGRGPGTATPLATGEQRLDSQQEVTAMGSLERR